MAARRAVLLGHPVAHSISPIFQQAAFDALGLDVHYDAWDTPEADLEDRVARLRGREFLGANVTLPHKQRALPLADAAVDDAIAAGAANVLVSRGGQLAAHNTDIGGFRRALCEVAGFDAAGKRAVVLGAGGTARAVVLALAQASASGILVLNRTLERAEGLVESLRGHVQAPLLAGALNGAAAIEGYDLLVHCTSIGMAGSDSEDRSPLPAAALPRGALIVDIVANPTWTPLLQQARQSGHPTMGGLPMLVYQGAIAFELWTEQPAPVDVMLRAARAAMRLD